MPKPNNVTALETRTGSLAAEQVLTEVAAEVVYAGGGNTVLMFASPDAAREFVKQLTKKVLKVAPGLELVAAHREFEWERESVSSLVQEMLGRDLARKKANRQPSLPLLATPVTVACTSTGLAAVGFNKRGQPVSREIKAKLTDGVQDAAAQRLNDLTPRIQAGGWKPPQDFDKMGRLPGEESYLAVVHADANRIGRRVESLADRFPQPDQNRAYIQAIRDFSLGVERVAQEALASAISLLADALAADPDLPCDAEYFPLRPVVFGGDDVTFVCNARYGLPLTVRYLQEFERLSREEPALDGEELHACAGVVVFKVHYPFARAYHLSEQLCRNAKRLVKQQRADCSALDWHFALSGITGDLQNIRLREYDTNFAKHGHERRPGDSNLVMRPVLLHESPTEWRTWPVFAALTSEFADSDGGWFDRRNKVKALREALRAGPDAVREFLRTYRLTQLPKAGLIPVAEVGLTGWDGEDRCVYFDSIEAMDLYTDLEAIIHVAEEGAADGNS